MRPHISLDVHDVSKSVAFYEKVFCVKPQKKVADYAKFDLKTPALNFSLVSSTGAVSTVDHLEIEVETVEEIGEWKARFEHKRILEQVEDNIACCFARQDKLCSRVSISR
jgi:catechol 2,3-dioxygenase-like lactoylglutathione lyase family enzyme